MAPPFPIELGVQDHGDDKEMSHVVSVQGSPCIQKKSADCYFEPNDQF